MEQTQTKNKKGFVTGYNQITKAHSREITQQLYRALGVKDRTTFYNYKNGKRDLTYAQTVAIEKVFNEYGITNIWDL